MLSLNQKLKAKFLAITYSLVEALLQPTTVYSLLNLVNHIFK